MTSCLLSTCGFYTLCWVLFHWLYQHIDYVVLKWYLIRVTTWQTSGTYTWQRMEGFPWQDCHWLNVNTLQMLLLTHIIMSAETLSDIFGEYYTNRERLAYMKIYVPQSPLGNFVTLKQIDSKYWCIMSQLLRLKASWIKVLMHSEDVHHFIWVRLNKSWLTIVSLVICAWVVSTYLLLLNPTFNMIDSFMLISTFRVSVHQCHLLWLVMSYLRTKKVKYLTIIYTYILFANSNQKNKGKQGSSSVWNLNELPCWNSFIQCLVGRKWKEGKLGTLNNKRATFLIPLI